MNKKQTEALTQTTEKTIQGRLDIETGSDNSQLNQEIRGAQVFPENTELTVCEPEETISPRIEEDASGIKKSGRLGKFWMFGLKCVCFK